MKNKILAIFIALVCSLAVARADWNDWKADYIGGTVVGYHRLADELINGGYRHWIQFENRPPLVLHVFHVQCNGSALEGWTKMGPSQQYYKFYYDDGNNTSNWTWESELLQ